MRLISDFEIVVKALITDELRAQIDTLKKSYAPAFVDGGIGKKGGLKTNFGARFILKNNAEGIFVFRRLMDLSKGFYEAYARVFVGDSDIPEIGYCDGNRNHKTIYTTRKICPICNRKPKKCTELTKDCKEQLKDFKVSMSEL
jgi:hypothetical protein